MHFVSKSKQYTLFRFVPRFDAFETKEGVPVNSIWLRQRHFCLSSITTSEDMEKVVWLCEGSESSLALEVVSPAVHDLASLSR